MARSADGLDRILSLLQRHTAVDFELYKPATLRRRAERRMALHKLKDFRAYGDYLRSHPGEIQALFDDLLIAVTEFFRDPAVFASLKRNYLAQLVHGKAADGPIRVWVPACSTGEEIYSIAILLAELLQEKKTGRPVQFFGTDINDTVLEKARAGLYPELIRKQISPQRLRRYFEPVGNGYRICKAIRDHCVFARHNLATDPPFSNLDLISCRNALIYFTPELQKKIVPVFHFALKPGGALLLGASETINGYPKLFSLGDKAAKLYRRNPGSVHLELPGLSVPVRSRAFALSKGAKTVRPSPKLPPDSDLGAAMEKLLREHRDLSLDETRVLAVTLPHTRDKVYLVLADPKSAEKPPPGSKKKDGRPRARPDRAAENRRLRQELLTLRASLHGILDQAEAANEELETAKEEVVSSNEELQSANEELETAKEEIQSANEELTTTNDELEKRNAELELGNILANRFKAIVESSSDAIISKDLNGVIQTWNLGAERIFGYSSKEVVGKSVSILIPDDRPDEEPSILARLRVGEKIDHYETIRRRKDGELIAISLSVSPIRDSTGTIIGASKIARDVTEKKRMEAELDRLREEAEQANRAKDGFLAALSHELRTPLSPILLVASDAATDVKLPAERRADFELIRSYAEIEARLIDDLLDLTRIATGKLRVDKREVDAQAILLSSVAMVRGEAERNGIELTQKHSSAQGVIYGDPVRLHQIYANVLSNAVKFTPAQGRIRVDSRIDEGRYVVTVSDTGIGMTRDELAYAFDAFRQGSHSREGRSPGGLGLGLGLTISRKLVDFHGGTIEAASGGRGAGTAFTIAFPLASRSGASAPQEPHRERSGRAAPAGPVRVLLVEDDDATRIALSRLLAARRHEVLAASTVKQALELAAKSQFDVVVSDIGLPDGNGYSLFQELRKREPSIRGIALTGYGMTEDLAQGRASGFDVHLTKPVQIQALEAALSEVLAARD